ncbi:glutamate dehydrogenase [Gregarina niphandrodes]|uniref:Glutamate dehydrogenase n=1 Tax=Gregarina niphandrodes TaxID=110365 RepID=A0A023B634_GRENI|nr:glutamate dehydrogenase [Gregarina niphandrodes]EZG65161.1 glutamate dehydrogenase [Gregarina niphandrodes]|eukprot:XP_011134095.1 glutamate dehydrogenase [Gregarina niphandrodes]
MSNTIFRLKRVLKENESLRNIKRSMRSDKYQKQTLKWFHDTSVFAQFNLKEFCNNVRPLAAKNPSFVKALRVLCEPESVNAFVVEWKNKHGELMRNNGWRCNYSSLLGACRGGVRFHPSVNQDVIVALAFEVSVQNALTNLPMGGCFMGSDFNARICCDADVQSFCNAFVVAVRKELPANWPLDITCDLGCGPRECAMLAAAHAGVVNSATGKPFPQVVGRPAAAGLGAVEFGKLFCRIPSFDKTRCLVSGSGDCALTVARNLIAEGAVVLTLSDSSGFVHCATGITYLQWQRINEHRQYRIPLRDIVSEDGWLRGLVWRAGDIWQQGISADYAFPCAHELEIDIKEAEVLADRSKIKAVLEVSYTATSDDAQSYLVYRKVKIAPSKAVNAGAMVALGMHLAEKMDKAEFEHEIKSFMSYLHDQCRSVYDSYYPDIYFKEAVDICALLKLAKIMKEKDII